MKKYLYLSAIISGIATFWACSNQNDVDKNTSVIIPEKEFHTEFDKFLKREFKDPYNIDFLYRMPDIETRLEYDMVPASYENSVKMANVVKYFFLEPYERVISKEFLKKYFPKMLLLVGSPAYKKSDGRRIAGEAEGGMKIALMEVNRLNTNNFEQLLTSYLHTIYHEFSHILHQHKDYPNEFRQITASKYNGDSWVNVSSDAAARREGFISRYSMKDSNEDFVELIAHYITKTESEWNRAISPAGEGKAIIEQKMEIVKSYLENEWQINLDALRDEIQSRGGNINAYDFTNIN